MDYETEPYPKRSGFRVYCDESNTDGGKRHPVYGAILVSLDDIRTVQRELKDWRDREGMHGELKWHKINGGLSLAKYKSLVDLLVLLARRRRMIQFKAIVLDKHSPEYRVYSKGDDELAFYKFYYHWLLAYFAKFPIWHQCDLRVIIDERTLPADAKDPYTVLKIILNSGIRKTFEISRDVVSEVRPLPSHESDLLQAADVLMGAVGFHNQGFHLRPGANKYKVELASYIARKFRVRDLTQLTSALKEDLKITRWVWSGQKLQYRRKPTVNPRPRSRRPYRGK